MKVSACILCKNESKYIFGLLDNLLGKVDEIIVLDGHSTDGTVGICHEFTDKVYQRQPCGYADPDREYCMSLAKNNWILMADADERFSSSLLDDLDMMTNKSVAGYKITRRNYYSPDRYYKHINYPDLQVRLYRKNKVQISKNMHGTPTINGILETLPDTKYIKHLEPIYSDRIKYKNYAKIHASQIVKKYPSSFYPVLAPIKFIQSAYRDIKAGCGEDGMPGYMAAYDRAYYNYWVCRYMKAVDSHTID